MSSGFDRLRPRAPHNAAPPPRPQDAEGKRALFSGGRPSEHAGTGSFVVECSRCAQTTVLSPAAALRVFVPAVHLAFGIARGERRTVLGFPGRRYGSWLRCPSCGRLTWVRVTLQL